MADTTDTAAQIEALRAQIAELAGVVSGSLSSAVLMVVLACASSRTLQSVTWWMMGSLQTPEPDFGKVDLSPLKPFDIQYFFGSDEWKIYLPAGCVMADGKAATYRDGTDGNDMAVITPAETLWAHVGRTGSTYEFTIDDEAPQEGEGSDDGSVHFKVASFNSEGTQVMVQYASGVVTVGGHDYVCGDNSNIVFERCDDPDDNDRYGRTMIDVYYL